jgi:lysophospholipase L1-like esterase
VRLGFDRGPRTIAAVRTARYTATIVIATLIAGCGSHARDAAQPQRAGGGAQAQDAGGPQLVVVGDSLAAGRFAGTQAEAFPQEVAGAMHARLELFAAPGLTTAQLTAQAAPGRADAVVVEAGTNDFLYQTPRRRFADDYRALLAKVEAAAPGAKLVCLTTWVPKGVTGRQPATIPVSFYDQTIRRACTAGAVADISPLTDERGPSGRETFLGPGDDFHPNSTGHAEIARLIESRLR